MCASSWCAAAAYGEEAMARRACDDLTWHAADKTSRKRSAVVRGLVVSMFGHRRVLSIGAASVGCCICAAAAKY